ncbi:hypothetical protein ABIF07_000789 [Bradyrhizobium elkanii]
MEADDLGLQLLDNSAERGIERRAVRGIDLRVRVEPVLPIIGCEPLPPDRFARRIGVDRPCDKRSSG